MTKNESPARKTTAKTDAGQLRWIDRSMKEWAGVNEGQRREDWVITLPSGATYQTWITLAQAVELEAQGIDIKAKPLPK
jgi:hypothetical protein